MNISSVYKQFQQTVAKYQKKPFLHIPASALQQTADVDYNYGEALLEIDKLVEQYRAGGLQVSDKVAILLENRAEFFMHWFALNALGVCVVPVNGEMTAAEIDYLLDDSDVCLAIALTHRVAQLEQVTEKMDQAVQVVACDQLDLIRPTPSRTRQAPIDTQTQCALLYTSGSTGKPKGCILTNEYFLASGQWYATAGGLMSLKEGAERLITPLPLVHMNAMACSTMAMIVTGGCVIQLDRFHPRSWWQTVRQSNATLLHYLGVLPAILLNMEPLDDDLGDDFSSQIKFGFGAGVNPEHHRVFEQRFGFPLIESWGMTETGGANCITAMNQPRHVGSSCVGRKPDHIEIKLVDESGQQVEADRPGELLVRHKGDNPRYGFFSGYYNNQQATDLAWQDGWLHTGDIVHCGADGSYYFVDRLKNVIRRSGENISALEVEANLSLFDLVEQVAVTAVPDEIRGDEVIACIQLAPGIEASLPTAEMIFKHAMSSLVYFKAPGYIAFVDDFPLTASNKLQRAELKKMARELIANDKQADNYFDLRSLKKKQQ